MYAKVHDYCGYINRIFMQVDEDVNKNEPDSDVEVFLMTSWNKNIAIGPTFKKEDAAETLPVAKSEMKVSCSL
jgi:hypothetical protein